MAIINIPEDQLAEKFKQAVIILAKIRRYQKIWYEHYGSMNRRTLARWENNADQFLSGIDVELDPEEQKLFEGSLINLKATE